jgi:hypothetical protein
MVVFNTTLLTPYQDSLEASLMFGGVRSALADFDPYVTGDQVSIVIPCRNEDAYIIRTLEVPRTIYTHCILTLIEHIVLSL